MVVGQIQTVRCLKDFLIEAIEVYVEVLQVKTDSEQDMEWKRSGCKASGLQRSPPLHFMGACPPYTGDTNKIFWCLQTSLNKSQDDPPIYQTSYKLLLTVMLALSTYFQGRFNWPYYIFQTAQGCHNLTMKI